MQNSSLLLVSVLLIASCGGADEAPAATPDSSATSASPSPAPEPVDDAHPTDPLGTVELGDLTVELAQGHGAVRAGAEGHLVVKLPYTDGGATSVRAWIGTEDRTLSYVGKGTYAEGHDDYDVHATAPDPLPASPKWWIEIEKPDGTRVLGSADPILE